MIKKNFNKQYKKVLEILQLSFLYFFSFLVLIYSVKMYLGFLPGGIFSSIPLIQAIFNFQFLRFIAAPERTFFFYILTMELIINRNVFKVSKLVKYNILLIFILEMIQNVLLSYWELLFNRQISLVGGPEISILDKTLLISFFSGMFSFFTVIYGYSYIKALQGKFVTFPYLEWLTDSIAFWLQIKTPTMPPFGKQ